MPRNFLAPYKFEINSSDGGFNKLYDTLKQMNFHIDESDKTLLLIDSISIDKQNQKIYGNLKYGKFGSIMDVIDVKTGEKKYTINENESALDKYFYMIEFLNKRKGFMVLQRIGNIGVRTAFAKALHHKGIRLKIEPIIFGIKELLRNPIMEIRIKIPKKPRDVDSRLEKLMIDNEEENYVEVVVKARKNKFIEIKNKIRNAFSNMDLKDIGYIYDENEEITITLKVGDSRRTINIHKGKYRTWLEVRDRNKILEEAIELISELKRGENDV